jgi:hypothetical protein
MTITISNSSDMVSIELTVSYEGPSEYTYVVNPNRSLSYKSPGDAPRPFPHAYDIDPGDQLLVPGKGNNNWSIQLLNPSNMDLKYDITITWHQSGRQVMQWNKKDTVTANGGKLINDDCSYMP